jgi:hypothetical protein
MPQHLLFPAILLGVVLLLAMLFDFIERLIGRGLMVLIGLALAVIVIGVFRKVLRRQSPAS